MKIFSYAFALATISIMNIALPCAVTIINDSLDPIIVTTNDPNNSIFTLLPEQEKEFGDHHVKAKFTVLFKDAAGNYIQQIAVRQHACSGSKEIRLYALDLAASKLNEHLFIFGKPGTVDLRRLEFCH